MSDPIVFENSTPEDVLSLILSDDAKKKGYVAGRRPNSERKDRIIFSQIEISKDGGIFCHSDQLKYPVRGYPFREGHERVDLIKKFMAGVLNGLLRAIRKHPIPTALFVLFAPKKEILQSYIDASWKQLQPYEFLSGLYCRPVREVWRVMREMSPGKIDKEKHHYLKALRRIIAMILEFDDAYCYRFQHVMGYFNKEKFERSPVGELILLTHIGEQNENNDKMKRGWQALRLLLRIARFYPSLKKDIVAFFKNLTLEEIKLSVEDRYFAEMKKDYKWQ